MEKQIICTVCPRGCHITAIGDGEVATEITGYACPRGKVYAENEYSAPVRILTTLVKLNGAKEELLPVRSSKPILKEKIFECMEQIKKVSIAPPVKRYDVIIENICGTGVDIVATKDVE